MKTAATRIAVVAALLAFAGGCGPQEPSKLKVATVDIVRIMEERPETRKIRLEWARQAGDTYVRLAETADSAEALALQQEIQKRSEEWQRRMDNFMDESVNLVEKEAAALAKEHNLDIVVVDNPMTKTVRYSDGEDLTLDISFKLQNGK